MANNQDVQFILEHASENWHYLAWVLLAVVCCIIAIKQYGPRAPGAWGISAVIFRCLALITVILMLAGPAWETTEHHVQPGQITIALDLSASMNRDDTEQNKPRAHAASDLFHKLEERKESLNNIYNWKSLCANGVAINLDDIRTHNIQASGPASKLTNEILKVVSSSQQDALILISDGRSTDEQKLEQIAGLLREREIDVYILACGSDAIQSELELIEIIGNRDIARGERQPFTLKLNTRGLIGKQLQVTVSDGKGDTLTEQTITVDGQEDQNAQLLHSESNVSIVLHEEGDETLHFEIEGPDGLRSAVSIQCRVSERKLRVLMLAHHPRYEMRYLRNALDRDHTVDVHSYLADGRWRRWGADRFGPDVLPLQSQELKEYDAIIIGDVSGNALGIPAQENIVRAVRQFGLGLIWIPGERGAIADFRNAPLGKLIPADLPDRDSIQRAYLKGIIHQAHVTTLGQQTLNAGKVEWKDLPHLIGNCPLGDELTKGTEVLMRGADETPLIVSRRYSTGRSTLIAIDDTWRWRKDVGDFYLHRFHSSLLRYSSSGRQLHRKPWQIVSTPSRVRIGEGIQINVNPTGPIANAETLPNDITLRMKRDGSEKIIRLHRAPNNSSYGLSTAFYQAGSYQLEIADGINEDDVRNSELTILNSTAENSDPRLDLASLQALADATGGSIFTDAKTLAQAVPDRQRRRTEYRIEAVWDSLWFLIIAISLFCLEWAIRRHYRLP